MPPPKLSRGFSFFGGASTSTAAGHDTSRNFSGQNNSVRLQDLASLKLQTDKDVYRPGDPVLVTIEIRNNSQPEDAHVNEESSLLIENITFEMKGIEKLDTQWFATQKPTPDSKQKRGEYIFISGEYILISDEFTKERNGLMQFVMNSSCIDACPKGLNPGKQITNIKQLQLQKGI